MHRWLSTASVVVVLAAGCSSGSQGPDRELQQRLRAGFAEIEGDRTLSVEFSVSRTDDTGDEHTLSCVAADVDPRFPAGDHVYLTNWGASTTLDADGGCLGGGDPHSIATAGDVVYLESGPPPPHEVACLASYRRSRLSASARRELAGFTRSQGPDVDDLLKSATGGSVTADGTVVTLDLDPDAATSRSSGSLSGSATPDSVTMMITFSAARSNRVTGVDVETSRGDDTVEVRSVYSRATASDAAPPPRECVEPGLGAVSDLDEVKSALGL